MATKPLQLPDPLPRGLNLGCGAKRLDDCVNVDISAPPRALSDLTVDLNEKSWPLPSDYFTKVYAFDVIEHLNDTTAVMKEILRVSSAGAEIHLVVPHFSSANAFADPQHVHQFTASSFDFFGRGAPFDFSPDGYFQKVSTRIFFHPSLINKIVWRLANRFPETYERRWAFIFPAWFIEIKLAVVK